jgi:hypothetical protein
MNDPVTDSMSDRIEEKVRDLVLSHVGSKDLAVVYRGDPFIVPVKLYPFAFVMLTVEREDARRGRETGPATYWSYEGFVNVETLVKDVTGLVPDRTRRADVPSYALTRRLVQAARQSVYEWGGPAGTIRDSEQVVSATGKERTIALEVGEIQNGLQERGDNVSNTGLFRFAVVTRREEY